MGGESTGAEWRPDPSGKYELRYWDGVVWTDQVSDGGQRATDPFFRPENFTATALAAKAPSGGRRAVLVVGLLVVVAAVALAIVLVGRGDEEVASEATTTSTIEESTTTTTEATTTTEEATTTTTEPELEDPSEVVGTNVATAISQLEDAGFVVTETETIDTTVANGEVVAAEEQPDGSVVLTVARPPVTRFLEILSPVELEGIGFDRPTFDISGTTYSHGISLGSCFESSGYLDFDLGRDFRRFQATIGQLSTNAASTRVRVEISLDGAIVSTQDFAFGEVAEVDLDVTGKLRLRIAVTALERDRCYFFGFGDGRLLGVPSEVPPETAD